MKSLSPEKAIAILSNMKVNIPVPKAAITQKERNVALDMAIAALEQQEKNRWIPVTERLPEENGTYLACYEDAMVLLDWFNDK